MAKIYDVYFTLADEGVIAIEANNEDEAEKIFNNITWDEISRYIYDAVSYGGFEITSIEEVDQNA